MKSPRKASISQTEKFSTESSNFNDLTDFQCDTMA